MCDVFHFCVSSACCISRLTRTFGAVFIPRLQSMVSLSLSHVKALPGVNPKGAGRKGALLLDVYGDLTPKEKCTCRVRAHGGGWRDAACAEVALRAGATVDGQYSSYNFEQ